MTIYYGYTDDWPSRLGYEYLKEKKIVQSTLPSHGNGFVWVETEPQVAPVTLDEVKLFAKIDGTSEDSLIETVFIPAAREAVEGYLKKSLVEQTLVLSMDWWPEPLKLPRPPLISVTEVRTVDEEGAETTYAASNYIVRTGTTPGQIVIKTGVTPPVNTERYQGGYEVEYKAGYGSDSDEIPGGVRQGVLMLVSHMYHNRTPTISGATIAKIPGLKEILGMHRRIRV